jgi:thioredoxin-like negative regulator of GroEL
MQAEMTDQGMSMSNATPAKTSFWKTSALYAILAALFLLALVAYGYSQGWLKHAGSQASEVIASTFPSMAQSVGVEDTLSKARAAFASGDVNGAIEGYRQILAKNPDDIAARGELGNVFYTVGMVPEAAQTYFDTASKAIDKNQPEVAEALLPAIIEGNPMLATQLNDKLFDAQMRATQQPQSMPEQEPTRQPQGPQQNS